MSIFWCSTHKAFEHVNVRCPESVMHVATAPGQNTHCTVHNCPVCASPPMTDPASVPLPCPFCGEKPYLAGDSRAHFVGRAPFVRHPVSTTCPVSGVPVRIAVWNRRIATPRDTP